MIKQFVVDRIKIRSMNIFSFTVNFDSEASFREHFKQERDKVDVACHKCSHTEHYLLDG